MQILDLPGDGEAGEARVQHDAKEEHLDATQGVEIRSATVAA